MSPVELYAYRLAEEIQDACNPVAVIRAFSQQVAALSHGGLDHPTLEQHPAILAMLDKVNHLFGLDLSGVVFTIFLTNDLWATTALSCNGRFGDT